MLLLSLGSFFFLFFYRFTCGKHEPLAIVIVVFFFSLFCAVTFAEDKRKGKEPKAILSRWK
jgi:hypothetical protein